MPEGPEDRTKGYGTHCLLAHRASFRYFLAFRNYPAGVAGVLDRVRAVTLDPFWKPTGRVQVQYPTP